METHKEGEEEEREEGVCWVVDCIKKKGQAASRTVTFTRSRRGDTDKVSSPPLGQAVITVGPRFQVATLSGTGIIGSRLGATTQPQCGPAMPLSNSEAWL